MILEDFIDSLTTLKDNKKINFNDVDNETYKQFVKNFDKLDIEDKKKYLYDIIDMNESGDLLSGNFEKWLSDEKIKSILKSII